MKILHIITTLRMGFTETIITFVGYLGSNNIAQQLRNIRNCLKTAFVEGTHATILEAMIFGSAVVISKSNAYVETKKNGYIFKRFQAEYYVERYQYLLDNESLLPEISRRNAERAISYGWLEVAMHISE